MERATSKSDASDHGEEIRISCCSGGSIHWEEGKGDRKKIVGLIREIGARSWNSKYKKRKKKIIENFWKFVIIDQRKNNYFTLFLIEGIILKNLQRNENFLNPLER